MQTSSITLNDIDATKKFAEKFIKQIAPGSVIFLTGNLGAGKTTLTRFILGAMGFEGIVKSPTYSIVESYDVEFGRVHHFDLYRLESVEDLEAMGLRDFFNENDVCIIEWPDRLDDLISPDIEITLNSVLDNPNSRTVELKYK